MRMQLVDVHWLGLGEPGQQLPVTHQHHGLLHRVMATDRRFNLAQFDTHTANLHLIVIAPQIVQIAVGTPTSKVTGAIHAGVRLIAERIAQEAFGAQFGLVQIPTGDTGTTDVQLASNAWRQRLLLLVEQIQRGIAHRFTDVQRLPRFDFP
jgi:hypothetical protein